MVNTTMFLNLLFLNLYEKYYLRTNEFKQEYKQVSLLFQSSELNSLTTNQLNVLANKLELNTNFVIRVFDLSKNKSEKSLDFLLLLHSNQLHEYLIENIL